MRCYQEYSAHQALSVVRGTLTPELSLTARDKPERTKAQVFEIGPGAGKQFAIVLGSYDKLTERHSAAGTRMLLERCSLPSIPGVELEPEPYKGQRIAHQKDSKLGVPNQVSCWVADETALKSLLRWYARS